MFIRTKNGSTPIETRGALLDFLGLGKEEYGTKNRVRTIKGDIELIAPVPFLLSAQEGEAQGIAWTFSTFDLDRFDERIDPAGWELKQYLKNPVVEWAHRYDIPAIGKAEGIYTDERGLHGTVVFNNKDYDPFGWAIGERVKNGVIRAGSVGFRILEIELPSKEDGKDGTSLIFRQQELLEFSICNVPANPYALAKYASAKAINAANSETFQGLGSASFWGGLIRSVGPFDDRN